MSKPVIELVAAVLMMVAPLVCTESVAAADLADTPAERAMIAMLKAHKARDGQTVEWIAVQAARYGFHARNWAADEKADEVNLFWVDEVQKPKDQEFFVEWSVDAHSQAVTPKGADARVMELGAAPFDYYLNQQRADHNQPYDRKLVNDLAVLAFLPSRDGDLATIFRRARLTLRRVNLEWLEPGHISAASSYQPGYVVWVFFDCPVPSGANPLVYRDQQIGFVEPDGVGGFRPFNRGAEEAVNGSGVPCAIPPAGFPAPR